MRIAILTHSTNLRGGVVHALQLAEALLALGHEPVVHAPDMRGTGFPRAVAVETVSVPASPVGRDMAEMVEIRAADYVRHFEAPANRRFDVFHVQDGISANALATLTERGLVPRFARTVHHIDDFADPRLAALQERAIRSADRHFVVSELWQRRLAAAFGIEASIVGNGVDRRRFTPAPDGRETELKARLGLGPGPMVLSVGGVEARKNSTRILEAFAQVQAIHASARLVIAGGASVLDHRAYQEGFEAALALSTLPPAALLRLGPVADADMPALYRLADVLAFPSLNEGFGLAVLEAMASGVPVVTSRIAPFTEYLGADDVAWCDPLNVGSIANALMAALGGPLGARLAERGLAVAARHDWSATARAHLDVYEHLRELQHA